MSPDDNKIEDAIGIVSSALSIAKPAISYCDFRYPTANTLMVVGEDTPYASSQTNKTFRIFVPTEIANNISRFEWFYQSGPYSVFGGSQFGMHNQVIDSGWAKISYGTITLVPSTKPDELVQPTELKLDTLTTAWVFAYLVEAKGGFIILLHYD